MHKFYMANNQIVMNYNRAYPRSREVLLKSKTFQIFIRNFILEHKDNDLLFNYLTQHEKYDAETAAEKFVYFMRQLSIFNLDEIDSEYTQDREALLEVIENIYKTWRDYGRYGFMKSEDIDGFGVNTLVAQDSAMNDMFLRTYRMFEEKVLNRYNRVYRQVQAGTNACFSIHTREQALPEEYAALQNIPIIDTVMLRTPMILHTKSSKRTGVNSQIDVNPMTYFNGNDEEWFCFPCKVGDLVCLVYFHIKYMSLSLSLANLFELATKEEAEGKPDLICIVGNPDGKNETNFYHDKKNNIFVGCISDDERMDYFGYLKKMCLTLHNVYKMQQGWLPIHGAFVKIVLNDGTSKNIMLMGDSGAGKSESIEALKAAGQGMIREVQVIFDDMGSIHIEDGVPYGQGTEIGAFIRLDDLEPGTPYRDMDRAIFMSPEHQNSRMVTPASPYSFVVENHTIDFFAYANNYTDKMGINVLSVEEAKEVCKMGKRMALGTTQEVGISTTYFANPFGPMQMQDVCDPLIDEVFQCLKDNNVFVGEIYTHLGFSRENRKGLNIAADELLQFITKEGK